MVNYAMLNKLLKLVHTELVRETEQLCNVDLRDLLRLTKESELSFFNVDLPAFGSAILSCLESGSLPLVELTPYFRPLLSLVYEDPLALECLRQLTDVFKRLEVPYDPQQVQQTYAKVKAVDEAIGAEHDYPEDVLSCSRELLKDVLKDFIVLLQNVGVPKHGPGAVFERLKPHQKWRRPLTLTPEVFHLFGPDHCLSEFNHYPVEFRDHFTSRYTIVPKDARGPRTIAIEPFSLMFYQQEVMGVLYKMMGSHPLLKWNANANTQENNKSVVREASLRRHLATIDLSEASDRVSLRLVKALFPEPLLTYLIALRSTYANLQGELIKLNKFAPMGSALCFPVETLAFWAISAGSIAVKQKRLNLGTVKNASRKVVVFGDDIIVPSDYYTCVSQALEDFQLKVNSAKSFVSSFFRESCGEDYYKGHRVTPVRLKRCLGRDMHVNLDIIVSFSNQLYLNGWWRSAQKLREFVDDEFSFHIRVVNQADVTNEIAYISLWQESHPFPSEVWNPYYQVVMGKTLVRSPKSYTPRGYEKDGVEFLRSLIAMESSFDPGEKKRGDPSERSRLTKYPSRGFEVKEVWLPRYAIDRESRTSPLLRASKALMRKWRKGVGLDRRVVVSPAWKDTQ
jgi:hypothetical protein